MTQLDYRQASDEDRLRSILPGDVVGDYRGYPEVQAAVLQYEAIAGGLGGIILETLPSFAVEVFEAKTRLNHAMSSTPVTVSRLLTRELGVPVMLKREDLTPIHSFKLRGAYNKIAQLTDKQREKGILAASAGNHAQGVATSVKLLNNEDSSDREIIEATIVMPKTTPEIKVKAVERTGARVIQEGNSYTEAYSASQKLLEGSELTFIDPFDDPEVIAGQGTVGLEILEQVQDVTHIFVPVGGGGLLAGVAQTIKVLRPDVKVIGVQTEESDAVYQSWRAGHKVVLDEVGTFADGVAVKEPGDLTLNIIAQHVDDIVRVTTDQICGAMATFKEETRADLEPAGALAIAGMRQYAADYGVSDNDVYVPICSGANTSPEKLAYATERANIGLGREALFAIRLAEEPGALRNLCQDVINNHNITRLRYRLNSETEAHILVGFATKSAIDRSTFLDQLAQNNYQAEDFSDNEFVREHLHALGGGTSGLAQDETLYEITFPERPGALLEFLSAVGDEWNISLFDYQQQGGDSGRVLIGFELHKTQDQAALESAFHKAGQAFSRVTSSAAKIFL